MANEPEFIYERAFPGRFLKAPLFDGKKVTLTLESAFMEILEGDKGKENRLIFSFVGKSMQMVCNKTNALCMKEMFSNKISNWVGKRVVFYPAKVNFGSKMVDSIRIHGSPDINADIEIAARIGRKNFKATLRKTGAPAAAAAPTSSPVADTETTPYDEYFERLCWNSDQRAEFMSTVGTATPEELRARLNAALETE